MPSFSNSIPQVDTECQDNRPAVLCVGNHAERDHYLAALARASIPCQVVDDEIQIAMPNLFAACHVLAEAGEPLSAAVLEGIESGAIDVP